MKKTVLVLVGLAVGLLLVSAACGGGGKAKPTATAQTTASSTTPEATATEAGTPSGTPETPPSSAQLAAYLTDIKAVMQDTLTKAQAGDVQGTRDAEAKGDTSMEAIIKALRAVGTATPTALGDQIEALELDYEAQADDTAGTGTDLTVIANDVQAVLPLLDQAGTTLGISP